MPPPKIGKTEKEGRAILEKMGVKLPAEEQAAATKTAVDDLRLADDDMGVVPYAKEPPAQQPLPFQAFSQRMADDLGFGDFPAPESTTQTPPQAPINFTNPRSGLPLDAVPVRDLLPSETPATPEAPWWKPKIGPAGKENALIGLMMGQTMLGKAAGAAGGAFFGPLGSVVGSAVGDVASSIGEDVLSNTTLNYSKADVSSYMPEGAGTSSASPLGNDRAIQNMLHHMSGAMSRMANIGVRNLGGRPNKV